MIKPTLEKLYTTGAIRASILAARILASRGGTFQDPPTWRYKAADQANDFLFGDTFPRCQRCWKPIHPDRVGIHRECEPPRPAVCPEP